MTEYIAWMEEGKMWQHSRMIVCVCAIVQCLSVVPRAKKTNLRVRLDRGRGQSAASV